MTEINYGDTFEETLKQWASECGVCILHCF